MISVRFLSPFYFIFFISEASGFCRRVLIAAAAIDANDNDEGNLNFSPQFRIRCEVLLALCRLNETTT